MTKKPWKSWHEVVNLRDDLKSGELPLHMFAADLYEVLMQRGKRPIYENPDRFFALTFPTYNLRQLVRDVVLRVAGKNDKAVRQLELTYGGGKTHTLIALRHLVADPANLPDLPSVDEFKQAIGQPLPRARVAGLCFDKLDVEKGMEVMGPDGAGKNLRHPWSVLAFQIAGDEGLKLLHADNKAEERDTAPAENLLTELLELPVRDGFGVLILIDEVLMYVREKVAADPRWKHRMVNFFQYLTQAATKVDRCCIVASLLASDPVKGDSFGRQLQGDLYDIFQRQREEAVEPVLKEDVAEVLRRRFFTPESIKDKDAFRAHVQAALTGVFAIDELSKKQGPELESRFLKSYPFHPDLTDVFYTKWTQLDRFQKARGVLRTFALALRESANWDQNPLVGPTAFLNAPGKGGISEALREMVTVADTEEHEGKKQAWTAIIEGEVGKARELQRDSIGLKSREIEQAVVATFFHSQPIGQNAKLRDLYVLIGPCRPDKIELEKGMIRWAQVSYWLDDQHTGADDVRPPGTWRLGNRPNLNQMHAAALDKIPDELVNLRLLEEIGKLKSLSSGASAMGVRVHTLPERPRDIDDDGLFHYAVLGPGAASDSGKPSPEAKRFPDETTGPEKPRVYRNAVILAAPSKDGLAVALARVRDFLAWERVNTDLKAQEKEGRLDAARMQTLTINITKARARVPESIRQAYSTVVTVSEKNEIHAFKINLIDSPHFEIIKNDPRSRIQDTAVSADALLPDGPYNLWREGESYRRVKDLSGAFAQLPHLPKMLKAQAILDTLTEGCSQGMFVLRLPRPDGSGRTWWFSNPDSAAMSDPAMELVLPKKAELEEIAPNLLTSSKLPNLWVQSSLRVQEILDYFSGERVEQVQRHGYTEPMSIPRADGSVVFKAVTAAVETGKLWLTSGPSSLLEEKIPPGVLSEDAVLHSPPDPFTAVEIMQGALPEAWNNNQVTGLSIATVLSHKFGKTLPWKTVKDVITNAVNARFLELDPLSGPWPCDYHSANQVILRPTTDYPVKESGPGPIRDSNIAFAETELKSGEIQDLGDEIPRLLDIKAKKNVPLKFIVRLECGDNKQKPDPETIAELNQVLKNVNEDLKLK